MRLPGRVVVFVLLLAVLALSAVGFAIVRTSLPVLDEIVLFSIFALLSVLAEVYATWVPSFNWEISSSIAIYLAALFILGPYLAVILVFVASLVSELLLRWSSDDVDKTKGLVPITFNVSQLVLTVTASGALLQLIGRPTLQFVSLDDYVTAIAAFAVYVLVNLSFVTGIIRLTERKRFFRTLWTSIDQFFVQYLVLCVSAVLLAVLRSLSVWHVFLALFPLTLVHVSFRGYVKLQTEARKTFERISQLLDQRDHYTAVHSEQVADLAVRIAFEMGLPQGEIEKVEIAARVHDIGKVAVPDAILLKPGPLNDEEWAVMKRHPVVSAELIEGLEIYSSVVDAVRHEHERWDGSGYPDGLRGAEIPLIARIIAAADIHNALSTDRPYRKAFSPERTMSILRDMKGVDLDPEAADALLRVIEPVAAEAVAPDELPAPAAEG